MGVSRSGSKTGVNIKCCKCRGTGVVVSNRPIGPTMVQQIRGRVPTAEEPVSVSWDGWGEGVSNSVS